MKALVIQNCLAEDIGLYEIRLQDKGIECRVHHAYGGKKIPAADPFDLFIVGGTPISIYEADKHDFLTKEIMYLERILKTDRPILGICGGGQLLARLLGAQVKKNPAMEIGGYKVKLTSAGRQSRFFKDFPGEFRVFQWHGDTFDLPAGDKLLVLGKNCKNQAFAHKKSLALQFHLETTSEAVDKWVEQYRDELQRINKTEIQVVNEFRLIEEQTKKLAYLLIDNFLSVAGQDGVHFRQEPRANGTLFYNSTG